MPEPVVLLFPATPDCWKIAIAIAPAETKATQPARGAS
jgi:hypothetical protein